MKYILILDLIRFAFSQNTKVEQLRYLIQSIIFYHFLAKQHIGKEAKDDTASSSQAGDDIYPLF